MRPERFHRLRGVLERRQPDLTVLMDGVHKPHNFSAVLRSCDAVGVLEAHVVLPDADLDLHHRTSAGTKKWVTVKRHRDASAAIRHLKERGFAVLAAHPSDRAVDYVRIDFTRPTAILMGAELHGVSDEGLRLADAHITIPMFGMVHSLNVSVAASLLLFEALRQRADCGMYDSARLTAAEFERRLFEWAYPSLARLNQKQNRPYPPLGPNGEILPEREDTPD